MPRPLRRLLHRAVDLLADPCESHNPFAERSSKTADFVRHAD
jgi:hypothetical protein